MNKSAIQKFAIWARTELIAQVSQRAYQYGITEEGHGEADAVTVGGRALTSEEAKQRRELVAQIRQKGFTQVMEEVAYTWFNRFIALRFMEVNNYLPSHIRVFSDSTGAFKPEILSDALHLDLPGLNKDKVASYIENNQTENLYRYLLLTQCNVLNEALPRMFEKMGGYTELLFPNNILKADSVLGRMVTDIPEEDWTDQVQIIGWLYQYYNTELNGQVYDGNMSKSRIPKELLPAATTIYTPDWAVRYMVENSLGRIWIEGHPDDELKSGWKYYLDENEQEPEVQAQLDKIHAEYATHKPQDIKIIDPCMGSGHILVYAFDVLIQIYKKSGVSERDAAQSILQNNLYGLDIDDRASQLAYFAVMMKARQYDRRIFFRGIQPHVYAIVESNGLDNITIDYFTNNDPKLKKVFGTLVNELRNAKEYGAILNILPVDFTVLYDRVEEVREDISLYRENVLNTILPLIRITEVMTLKYDVVVTNPPYLGSSRFSPLLDKYVKENYADVKNDLSMVMYKSAICNFAKKEGYIAFITTSSWMFLSSFEKLRSYLNSNVSLYSLVDFGTELFDGKVGHNPIVSWITRRVCLDYKMTAIRLVDYCYSRRDEKEPEFFNPKNRYTALQSNFSKIPGSPVAYWAGKFIMDDFEKGESLSKIASPRVGLQTGENDRFVRLWHEVGSPKTFFKAATKEEAQYTHRKWFPYNKGGDFRKWYGNNEYVVNWENDGFEIRHFTDQHGKLRSRPQNTDTYFRESITWSKISSGTITFRYKPFGHIYDVAGTSIFAEHNMLLYLLAFCNSKVAMEIAKILSPTINYEVGHIASFPIIFSDGNSQYIVSVSTKLILSSRNDWDSHETSWDFQRHPLIRPTLCLADAYATWKDDCEQRFLQLKANEEEINHIFIGIYGLQDELSPEVADKDVTVHRVFDTKDDVPESMQGSNYVRTKRDEIVSLISYAVGCMFGRYSLDVEGLAYAGGDWDASKYNTIIPDKDNIIPICDDDYFDDDITGRFVKWVEAVYGSDTLEENLKFIADALGGKRTPREVIRSYFLNDFYADHCKTYQKRPIYWLFDSGKKNGFKALIYMHRYRSDLLARMRTDYVHEQQERYRTQLTHIADALEYASGSERVMLTKKQKTLQDQSLEIQKYEEKIHHLADQNISIDLDDGVKHNYALFADVLAKIK